MGEKEETKYCPYCGVMIDYDIMYCPSCGRRQPSLGTEKSRSRKNPLLAGFLSLMVTGLGQLYLGAWRRALAFFLGTILVGLILDRFLSFEEVLIVGFVISIVAAMDAYQQAKKT